MALYQALNGNTEPGFYQMRDTLYLSIKPGGWKSWVQGILFKRKHYDRENKT